MAPSNAYLELEVHPEASVVYTFNLEIHRKAKEPNERKYEGVENGHKAQRSNESTRLNIGAIRKGV